MFARCSPETVRLRFFGGLRALPREYLDGALAGRPEVHDAMVAYRDGLYGRAHLVGLGSLAVPGDTAADTDAAAELGLLVTDGWQRRGVGAALMDALFARARARGVERVSAFVLPGRSALLAAIGRRVEQVGAFRETDGLTGLYKLTKPAR
jgi:GNAT superfamily N-acetyltransferase